jgi:hypothetical protein
MIFEGIEIGENRGIVISEVFLSRGLSVGLPSWHHKIP